MPTLQSKTGSVEKLFKLAVRLLFIRNYGITQIASDWDTRLAFGAKKGESCFTVRRKKCRIRR